jgi:hypothetical protein
MDVSDTKSVRFTAVVKQCGTPTVYLPLVSPKQDKEFMRAVKENKVMTVKQEPTTKHKDFGVVGFVEEKHSTYLVFPKALAGFEDARVVGIKYDVIAEGGVSSGTSSTPAKPLKVQRVPAQKPKPTPPEPKQFRVRVKVTSVTEREIKVLAFTSSDAKKQAARSIKQSDPGVTTVRVLTAESP